MTAAPTGPLRGLRVLELSGLGPAPFAAMMLADMGADVVMVDRPSGSLSSVPAENDVLRRSRRSITIDLRTPDGVAQVLALVAQADVLIEGFRPGVTERLGLGPDACWERNPRLVYGRMTGWGQEGPLAMSAGHDIGYIAITGALGSLGREGEAPAIPLNLVGDLGGGSTYLVMGVLAAVYEAQSSGRGQVVDAAIVDGALSLVTHLHGMIASDLWRDERGVNLLDSGRPWYDVYETADSRWLAVGAIEPKFWLELMSVLELDPDEARRADESLWPTLRKEIGEAIARRTLAEWSEIFDGTDACASPVLSLTEATQHPHLVARGAFTQSGDVLAPAPAPRFSRTPSSVSRPPARPGQHTDEVLAEWTAGA